jgi:hypothetical protein
VIAVARFAAAGCLAAQRWVPPALAYVVVLAATYAAGGEPLTNLSVGVAALFPVAAWVAVATLNDEDDDHAAVTAALAGGPGPVRRAKIALSAVVAAQLAVVGIALAAIRAPLAPGDLAAGVVADLAAILGGVALGAVCARPFLARTGSALLAICLVTLGELVVPGAPPVHLVLAALGGHHPHWAGLASGLAAGLGLFAAAASLTPG